MDRTIFVVFSAPFQELTFIRNGLLKELIHEHRYHCIIIVPTESAQIRIQPYFEKLSAEIVVYSPPPESFLEKLTHRIHAHKYEKDTGPYRKDRLRSIRRKKHWTKNIGYSLTKMMSKIIPEGMILALQHKFLTDRSLDRLFDKHQPVLTVLSWGGVYGPCPMVIRSARKVGCRTISLDASWDCMDELMLIPKVGRLLVWNEVMKQEAITKHRYKPDQISVIGLLRCDYYRQPNYIVNRDVFLNENKLDQSRKIITVAVNRGAPQIYIDVVNALLKADNDNRIGQPIQICLRLAPWSITEHYGELRAKPRVWVQSSYNFRSATMVQDKEIRETVNLLTHTDVLISVLSTLILESIFSNTPNISLRFPEFKSLYHRDFLGPLFETGGVAFVDDIPSLIQAVNRTLTHPQQDVEGRKRILQNLCHGEDGLAKNRAMDEIIKLL